jgi:hypothetical protein
VHTCVRPQTTTTTMSSKGYRSPGYRSPSPSSLSPRRGIQVRFSTLVLICVSLSALTLLVFNLSPFRASPPVKHVVPPANSEYILRCVCGILRWKKLSLNHDSQKTVDVRRCMTCRKSRKVSTSEWNLTDTCRARYRR